MRITKKNILGVSVVDSTLAEIVPLIVDLIQKKGKKTFFGGNPHSINLFLENDEFRHAMKGASCIYPEGTGTVLASRILGNPLRGRTNLLDYIFTLLKRAEEKKWSLYVLGGMPDVSRKALKKIHDRFPKLTLYGTHGYYKDEEKIIADINKKSPTILFVAMGSPKQEIWIAQNMKRLNAKAFFGIGGSIDIIAEKISRAPRFIRGIGFEWLYRTYKEPKRLWKRYIIGNTVFLKNVLKQWLIG